MGLRNIFGVLKGAANRRQELGTLFQGVEELLGDFSEGEKKMITAYAGLLGKVAYADMEISRVETEKIKSALMDVLHLGETAANGIIVLLDKHRVELFSIEDYLYVRMINELCGKVQKMALVEAMFAVAAADDSIRAEEDAAIRIVSKALRLSHKEFISVRARFVQKLDLLKPQADNA